MPNGEPRPGIAKRRRQEANDNAERYRDIIVPLRRKYSLRQIAMILNEQKCVNPSGKPWQSTTVHKILKRLGAN